MALVSDLYKKYNLDPNSLPIDETDSSVTSLYEKYNIDPSQLPTEEPGWGETITEAIVEDVPAGGKIAGGGLMQYLGTPDTGKIANWARMNPLLGPGIWTKDVIAGLWGDHLKSEGKKLATEGRKEHERALGQYVPGSAKHLTREIVSTTAEMLPAITLGIVTRNPTLSLTMMGTQAGSAKYDQSIREGRSHEAATIDGVFFGMAEAFTEKIPLGILVKRGG